MIKFDKVTLEPKFIDPSMCFCGGGGGGGGGGTPTKGTNAINRGTVGLSRADMNRRADAQERGSREVANLSAGISDNISSGFGRSPRGEVAGGLGDYDTGDDFVTSTEAAYRDLDRRAAVGQMPNLSRGFETPIGRIPTPTSVALGALNRFGMNRAQDIRNQIRGGGVPVTDRYGRIQGVVSEGTGPVADILGAFGQNRNVYTGGPSFAPSTSQLMSYRPDPTRQGIASLPYADVQMPTTTRAQPLSQLTTRAQRLSAPEIGSVINVDNRNFLVTEKGPVELKGTAEQEVVSPSPLMNSFAPGTQMLTPQEYYARETGQLSLPSSSTLPGQGGYTMSQGLFLDQDEMADRKGQVQNIGLFSEDPRAAGFRDLGNNIQSIINNEPLPDNQNMYGPGMQDFGPLTPDQLENYQDPSLSSQYGTVNDPTAQAGLGSFFTETVPEAFGSAYDYVTGAPKAKASGYSKPIGRGGVARQYYSAPGESFFKNPIAEYFSSN